MSTARIFAGALALLTFLFGCKSPGSKPTPPKTAPTVFHVRESTTQKLANGLTILWVPDSTLPYISFQLMIKAGSAQDPVGKEGLAFDTARLLSQGTAKQTAPQIAENIEQIGSFFGREVQADSTMISTSSLAFNRDSLLQQFREILLEPSFPARELERERKNALAGLVKLADQPDSFADVMLDKFLYRDHPYAHIALGSIQAQNLIQRGDVEDFYARYYRPSNAVLAVTGQFDDNFRQQIVDTFTPWPDKTSTKPELPDFPVWQNTQVLLVDRADLKQAQIEIGFKGIARDTPQYIEVRAAIKVLGDFFLGSRLVDEIRVKRGLTYNIQAELDPRVKPGPFSISTFTRIEKAAETIRESLKVYRNFVQNGVTPEEVSGVKALMRGQFPRIFETPESLARQLLLLNLYGVSPNYLKDFYANLEKISKSSIDGAIKRYFDPNNLRIVVYAPRKSVEAELKTLGTLEVKNYKDFLQ